MKETRPLADKILNRLERHRHELAEKQQQLDVEMKDILERRERLTAVAKYLTEEVVLPRMEELVRHFDNGKFEAQHADFGSSCICDFAHTQRFPATVKLVIALLPSDDRSLTARYDLSILPVFMEFNHSSEEDFPLNCDEELFAVWVDNKILEFVDTYILLETHPFYQKDNTVIDIVCGMHIPSTSATSSMEWQGRTFYFCSEHCREAFIKDHH